ncbi:MAG: glucosaminidase domain-containing protein [Bacteroidetes bacterium]|nr:glucosaminidase domain-containing protein [Bacteroidota bacterium]
MKKTLLIATLVIASIAASAQNTSQSYIQKFKDDAIRIMHQSGIPASIVLAVAMHESGCGNSLLAQQFNNQFGMKGYDKNILIVHNKKKVTPYKKYDSVMDSFEDFARVIMDKKKFAHLAKELTHFDYAGWAKGIQHSGYCSSHTWASQVMTIIRKYQLNLLDENPADQPPLVASAQ